MYQGTLIRLKKLQKVNNNIATGYQIALNNCFSLMEIFELILNHLRLTQSAQCQVLY